MILINDERSSVSPEIINLYNVSYKDVHDLYSYIEENKKQLIKDYLSKIDQFYFILSKLIPDGPYKDNILLYHFVSKRTDISDSFKNFCVISLKNRLVKHLNPLEISFKFPDPKATAEFSILNRIKLISLAASFLLKLILLRFALTMRSTTTKINKSKVAFYTQLPRQRGIEFDNINYGKVFNTLNQEVNCVYLLSILTDGIHDNPSWKELLIRLSSETKGSQPIWIIERAITLGMIYHTIKLFIGYVKLVLNFNKEKLSTIPEEDLFVFDDEMRPTIRRLFNYAYVFELSRNLSEVLQAKIFVYYLYEHNYGKLLSFHLHNKNITLGCQHGTMPHMRLGQYFTDLELKITNYPTYVIAEGFNHEKSLRWIYPETKVKVLGAPRIEHLANANKLANTTVKNNDIASILVPLSLHGEMNILDYVIECLDSNIDVHFYIKTHPAAGINQVRQVLEHLTKFTTNSKQSNYTIHQGNVYELLGRINYVLFADTSVGIEFAQAGTIPICVEPREGLNLSPLTDVKLFSPEFATKQLFISDPSDLSDLISQQHQDNIHFFPNDFYFANLGNSIKHWSDFILSKIEEIERHYEYESEN